MITVRKNEKDFNLEYVNHMVHHKNLENVLIHGLLSHNEAYKRGLITEDISMSEVQARRHNRNLRVDDLQYGVHDLVSFYLNSKNPMLYKRKELQPELVIILISADIIDCKKTDAKFSIVSDGNAGSNATKFYIGKQKLIEIDLELIFSGSWNNEDLQIKNENKRKMCAEVLIYPSVSIF